MARVLGVEYHPRLQSHTSEPSTNPRDISSYKCSIRRNVGGYSVSTLDVRFEESRIYSCQAHIDRTDLRIEEELSLTHHAPFDSRDTLVEPSSTLAELIPLHLAPHIYRR